MIRAALHSHWAIFGLGAILISLGLALLADGFDDYIQLPGGQYIRDNDEGYVLIGALLMTFGVLFALKGGRVYVNRPPTQPPSDDSESTSGPSDTNADAR